MCNERGWINNEEKQKTQNDFRAMQTCVMASKWILVACGRRVAEAVEEGETEGQRSANPPSEGQPKCGGGASKGANLAGGDEGVGAVSRGGGATESRASMRT